MARQSRAGVGEDISETRSRRKAGATNRARALRQGANKAEATLWLELKRRKLGGFKFTRQFPIGPYFADFACRERLLVVEVDCSQHAANAHDRRRDDFIRSRGYSILRFWNIDVLKHRTSVCETIFAVLDGRLVEQVTASDLRYFPAFPTPKADRLLPNQRLRSAHSPDSKSQYWIDAP